jgi:hypothetical protein
VVLAPIAVKTSLSIQCGIVKSLWIKTATDSGREVLMDSRKFRFKLTLSNMLLTFLNKLEEYTKSITD